GRQAGRRGDRPRRGQREAPHARPVMRVALLNHAGWPEVPELAEGLTGAGHPVRVLSSPPGRLDALLRRRGFTGPLGHLPFTAAALAGGGFDIAHAFSPPDAVAALAWRRFAGRPVVFTCTEVLSRETVAHARLRLQMLERAVAGADAVLAAGDDAALAMRRWLAIEAPALDASEHARLYGELLRRRG